MLIKYTLQYLWKRDDCMEKWLCWKIQSLLKAKSESPPRIIKNSRAAVMSSFERSVVESAKAT